MHFEFLNSDRYNLTCYMPFLNLHCYNQGNCAAELFSDVVVIDLYTMLYLFYLSEPSCWMSFLHSVNDKICDFDNFNAVNTYNLFRIFGSVVNLILKSRKFRNSKFLVQ